jgi:glycine/D-amino acid oxidase-like deaminating enzyme
MDLHSDSPYWLMKNGIYRVYPSVQENKKTEVAILGAGITGAIMGYYLHKAGFRVMLIDKRHAATGSTCASTALLQYEIDSPLTKLIPLTGERNAVKSYRLCLDALGEIGEIAKVTGNRSLETKPSLQYASFKKHVAAHHLEYLERKRNQFPVEWLSEKDIQQLFHFSAPGGILSHAGARMDPYEFTQDLLQYLVRRHAEVYDGTEIKKISRRKGKIKLVTDLGYAISADRLIIACGYESGRYLPKKVGTLKSTYAIISEPAVSGNYWYRDALIWETADPYLYLRTTKDNRIIIGGKDDDFSDPSKRAAVQKEKSKALLDAFHKLLPSVPFKTDFTWSGAFSTSKDGLPYIGAVPERKNTFFALGFGGNGIVFAVVAARIITDMLKNKKTPDAGIFRFNR